MNIGLIIGWLMLTGSAYASDDVVKDLCRAMTKFSTHTSVSDSAPTPVAAFDDAVSRFTSQNLFLRFLGGVDAAQEKVRATPEELLERAGPVFAGHNVETTPVTIEEKVLGVTDNAPGLQIKPNAEGAELNRFAQEMHEKYGVRIVYSPDHLQRSTAGYHATSKILFLPHDAVRFAKVDISMLHEKLHADFHKRDEDGKDSLFLGHILSVTSEPIWKGAQYDRAISLEELATFPDTLRRTSIKLFKAITEQDRTVADDTLKELRYVTLVSLQNMRNVDSWLEKALKEIEKNPEEISLENQMVGTHQRMMGEFIFDGTGIRLNVLMHHELKNLVEPTFNARITKEIGPIKTPEDKERATQILHSMMRGLFTQRLVEIKKLNRELLAKTEKLEQTFNGDSAEAFTQLSAITQDLWRTVESNMDWTPTLVP